LCACGVPEYGLHGLCERRAEHIDEEVDGISRPIVLVGSPERAFYDDAGMFSDEVVFFVGLTQVEALAVQQSGQVDGACAADLLL